MGLLVGASSTTAASPTAAPPPTSPPERAATVGYEVAAPTSDVPVETAKRLDSARVRDLGAASPRHAVPGDLADLGIPYRAYVAYRFAADALERADRSCGLDWTVLAAIGRIESDHGRYGGAKVGSDGTVSPVIRGIALDGTARHLTDPGHRRRHGRR